MLGTRWTDDAFLRRACVEDASGHYIIDLFRQADPLCITEF
jgi:hypothetical protein